MPAVQHDLVAVGEAQRTAAERPARRGRDASACACGRGCWPRTARPRGPPRRGVPCVREAELSARGPAQSRSHGAWRSLRVRVGQRRDGDKSAGTRTSTGERSAVPGVGCGGAGEGCLLSAPSTPELAGDPEKPRARASCRLWEGGVPIERECLRGLCASPRGAVPTPRPSTSALLGTTAS